MHPKPTPKSVFKTCFKTAFLKHYCETVSRLFQSRFKNCQAILNIAEKVFQPLFHFVSSTVLNTPPPFLEGG